MDRLVARRALVLRAGERHGGHARSDGDASPVARTYVASPFLQSLFVSDRGMGK
jgi:hypothetical protein